MFIPILVGLGAAFVALTNSGCSSGSPEPDPSCGGFRCHRGSAGASGKGGAGGAGGASGTGGKAGGPSLWIPPPNSSETDPELELPSEEEEMEPQYFGANFRYFRNVEEATAPMCCQDEEPNQSQ